MTKLITIFFPTCRIFPVQKELSFFVSWERIGKSSHIHQNLNDVTLVKLPCLCFGCFAWIFGTIGHETESDRDQRPFGPLGTQFSSFW